jgi:hypothetical protein
VFCNTDGLCLRRTGIGEHRKKECGYVTTDTEDLRNSLEFPNLLARDLEGRAVPLPDDRSGEHSLVIVAFRREQQPIVDSWIAWFESIATECPTLRCYELAVIATRWSPARPFIDGGMARAVRERQARRRTLTVYTDVRRVTDALAIDDAGVVTVLLVGADGRLRGRTTGSANEEAGVSTSRAPHWAYGAALAMDDTSSGLVASRGADYERHGSGDLCACLLDAPLP